MGIQNSARCVAKVESVRMSGMMSALRQMSPDNQHVPIDVDLHLLIMSKCRNETSCKSKVRKVMSMMKMFSGCICVVCPVADPAHRHHSKRASIRRRIEKIFKSVEITSARYELTQISQKLSMGSCEANEKEILTKEKDRLTKLAKKGIHPDHSHMMGMTMSMLSESIKEENLSTPNESGGSACDAKLGLHQAHVLLVKRFADKIIFHDSE